MKNLTPEYFIYEREASYEFYEKLESFHDFYVNELVASGVAENGTRLPCIDFSRSDLLGQDFIDLLIDGLSKFIAPIQCRLMRKKRLELECLFFDFGKAQGFRHVYMIQNIMDWTSKNDFNCQIWSILDADINTIDEFWMQ